MSSVQNIKDHGDLVEHYFAENFEDDQKDIIQKYNKLWGNYIGNDSNAKPLLIRGGNSINQNDRERLIIGQVSYTLLSNYCNTLNEYNKFIEFEEAKSEFTKTEEYFYYSALLIQLTNLLYNTLDVKKKISEFFSLENIEDEPNIKNFRDYRNSLMHDPRHLIEFVDEFRFPKFFNENNWSSLKKRIYVLDDHKYKDLEFINFHSYFDFCINQNKRILVEILDNGYNYLQNKYGASTIEIQEEDNCNWSNSNVSGSLGNPPNVSPVR
ncbi:MAG: hypothetical protein R2863_09105 [Candidatus Kapaibacterium sp.]|nr:hypothetical protein [Ignavibacteria bacterium]